MSSAQSGSHSVDELYRLTERLLIGEAAPAEHAQLQELLRADERNIDAYFAYIDLHVNLRQLCALAPETDPVADASACGCAPPSAAAPPANTEARSVGRGGRRSAMIAAGLILGALVAWRANVPPAKPGSDIVSSLASPEPAPTTQEVTEVVRLTQAAAAEFVSDFVPEIGSALQLGREYLLFKGAVELTFPKGASAIVQAPAVFTVDSTDSINVKIGRCSVHAPPGAEGFEVHAPTTRIVDLGTRFDVDVNETGVVDVQVVEGAATVGPLDEKQPPQMLRRGDALQHDVQAGALLPIRFNGEKSRQTLPDRVISYQATEPQPGLGVRDLTSVTVQRGGRHIDYVADEFIGVQVLHYRSDNQTNIVWDGVAPENPADGLESDFALTTGLINFEQKRSQNERVLTPYTSSKPLQQQYGLAVQFRTPVLNGPGPDVLLFDIQSVLYPPEGDYFRVSPLDDGASLHGFDVRRYDIAFKSHNAKQIAPFMLSRYDRAPHSLEALSTIPNQPRGLSFPMPFKALVAGIDLSDLGYAPGEVATGLFFQDLADDEHVVDPVLIVGLPWESSAANELNSR